MATPTPEPTPRTQTDPEQSTTNTARSGTDTSGTTGRSARSDTGSQRNSEETRNQEQRGRESMYTDRQRNVPVSREQGWRSSTLARPQQTSLFPALFSAPPGAIASAFMTNPFEFMNRINDDMNNWMDTVGLGNWLQPSSRGTGLLTETGRGTIRSAWTPQIEMFQRGNDLVVRADVPGLQKDDLDVRVENGTLIISGERRQEQEEDRQGMHLSERRYGSFFRTIALPEDVSDDEVSATYQDGVLEVTVPIPEQREQQRGKKIDIR